MKKISGLKCRHPLRQRGGKSSTTMWNFRNIVPFTVVNLLYEPHRCTFLQHYKWKSLEEKRISQSNRGPFTVKKCFFRKHLNSVLMLSTTNTDTQRHRHKSFTYESKQKTKCIRRNYSQKQVTANWKLDVLLLLLRDKSASLNAAQKALNVLSVASFPGEGVQTVYPQKRCIMLNLIPASLSWKTSLTVLIRRMWSIQVYVLRSTYEQRAR